MIEHTNETKVHEFHPHVTYVFDNLEHWFDQGSGNVWYNNRPRCQRCTKSWPNLDSVTDVCWKNERYWIWDEEARTYVTKGKLVPYKNHDLTYTVVVRDEHGTLMNPEWLKERRAEWRSNRFWEKRYSEYEYRHPDFDPRYLNHSNHSPLNRGLLPENHVTSGYWKDKGNYYRRYKHHGWVFLHTRTYRHPRSTNERRQYFACIVDDDAPQIRGRRKPRSLAYAWDDCAKHHDRSWKNNKKLRKQWMVNL